MKTTNQTSKTFATTLLGTIAIGGTLLAGLMAPTAANAAHFTVTRVGNGLSYSFINDGSKTDRAATAEHMALLAETLVQGNSVIQAHKMAFRALEHNQFNIRAQFVLKATQPMLELKGIYKRVEPIAKTRPREFANYQSYLKQMAKDKHQPDLSAYLLDGSPDLQSEGQVQDVIEKFVEKVDEFRDWLKENRQVAHTVNYYESQNYDTVCRAKEVNATTWVLSGCDKDVKKISLKMNVADFDAARQFVAGFQVYTAMTTAYSVDGVFAKSGKLPWSQRAKAVVPAFSQIKGVGHLRNTKFFALMPKVTADLVIGLKYAKKMHKELCPAGDESKNARKGMLFQNGICVEQGAATDRLIATLDLMARGQLASVQLTSGRKPVMATADIKEFYRNIPGDVRELGQVTYDKCGDILAIGDGRMNGLFPRAEMNVALRSESIENCRR